MHCWRYYCLTMSQISMAVCPSKNSPHAPGKAVTCFNLDIRPRRVSVSRMILVFAS